MEEERGGRTLDGGGLRWPRWWELKQTSHYYYYYNTSTTSSSRRERCYDCDKNSGEPCGSATVFGQHGVVSLIMIYHGQSAEWTQKSC